jgi:hypothetical protein
MSAMPPKQNEKASTGQPPEQEVTETTGAIPAGTTRQDAEEAIRDFDEGVAHGFGSSTFYDLLHNGRRYPPKAIMGLAGGETPQCFRMLRALGFEIVPKPSDDLPPEGRPRLWAIALGEGGRHFEDCRDAGIINIGWAYLGDLRQYPAREAIAARTKDAQQRT